VIQILALEMDLRAAQLIGQAPGVKDGAGSAHIVGKQRGQLVLEVLAFDDLFIGCGDLVHALLELWRHELAAVGAEEALRIGHGLGVLGHGLSPGVWCSKAAFIAHGGLKALAGKSGWNQHRNERSPQDESADSYCFDIGGNLLLL
jgi:hypothetical protein